MSTPTKEAQIKSLHQTFLDSKNIILTEYRGLSMGQLTELRKRLRPAKAEYKVVKNTLAKIASQGTYVEALRDQFEGPVAVVTAREDITGVAKLVTTFADEVPQFQVKGALVEGQVVDAQAVKEIAKLPPKEVLLARLLGALQSPIVGLVSVLQGNVRSLALALEEVRKQKETKG